MQEHDVLGLCKVAAEDGCCAPNPACAACCCAAFVRGLAWYSYQTVREHCEFLPVGHLCSIASMHQLSYQKANRVAQKERLAQPSCKYDFQCAVRCMHSWAILICLTWHVAAPAGSCICEQGGCSDSRPVPERVTTESTGAYKAKRVCKCAPSSMINCA